MKVYKLNKIFKTNTGYEAEADKAYIICAWGTNAADDVTIKIDETPCGTLNNYVANIRKINTNLTGPLPLGTLYLVVPPNIALEFESTATAEVRCLGEILKLAPGETLPGEYTTRFGEQTNHYLTKVEGADVSTGTSWAADAELSLYTLTPDTREKYIFNNIAGKREVTTPSPSEKDGDVGIRMKLEDEYFDIRTTGMGLLGIDGMSFWIPPLETQTFVPFTFADRPITLLGDQTIEFIAKNVSGAALFGTTGAKWRFYAIAEYFKWV